MKPSKKFFANSVLVLALASVAVSFQNCSAGSSSDSSSTTSAEGLSGDIPYPSSTPVILSSGQNITLRVAKPSSLSSLTNWMWVIYGGGSYVIAPQGLFASDGNYLYISVAVRSSLTAQRDLRIYLYNYSTKTYLDGNGIKISLRPSVNNPYSSDYVSQACSLSSYAPTFAVNRGVASSSAVLIQDNGAGVGSAVCQISGTNYDCLNTGGWPSNWASQTITITGFNRCGQNASYSFSP
ncbi:MAG: hypothetical protein J7501_17470 [Bdellovibrio sp.]|nr:hypothetical protein [Bdellovibrio sp.]